MPPTNAARTAPSEFPAHPATPDRVSVNDHHSRLNRTQVRRVERPGSVEALRRLVQRAAGEGQALCIAGGRHAMGGQQFAADAVLVDTTGMNRVLAFDRDRGQVEVDAGICWPDLIAWLEGVQQDRWPQWGIRQKQTGADRLSIGGSLSANAHGRGLTCKPFIDDVESFTLLGADGQLRTCSRDQNRALFALAIGGYGLFGIIITVRLRLPRRTKMQRLVSVIDLADLVSRATSRLTTTPSCRSSRKSCMAKTGCSFSIWLTGKRVVPSNCIHAITLRPTANATGRTAISSRNISTTTIGSSMPVWDRPAAAPR
jgi:FAD/FMN-containing dehydrogenase